MKPIIYGVSVMTDGRGDLYHYLDFIAAAAKIPENLENAYFVIDTMRTGAEHEMFMKIVNSFFDDHGLAHLKDKIIFVKRGEEEDEAAKLRAMLVANGDLEFNEYSISLSNSRFMHFLDQSSTNWHFSSCLAEHGSVTNNDKVDCSKFLSAGNMAMGFGEKSPGVFIPESLREERSETESKIFKDLGIPASSALTVCYSFVNTEVNILQICALHKQSGDSRELIIFLPRGLSAELQQSLQDALKASNCRLVIPSGWTSEDDFKKILIRQAQTASIGVAAGDKTTERCIAEGLFPIIEFKISKKQRFWSGLVDTLQQLCPFHDWGIERDLVLDANQKLMLQKIINYIKAAIEFSDNDSTDKKSKLQTSLLKSLGAIDGECLNLWHTIICPYLKQKFNLNDKIARNVQIFRMASALVQEHGIELERAQQFFRKMPQEIYEQYIKEMTERIQCYPRLFDKREVSDEALILLALNKVRIWASIKDISGMQNELIAKCEEIALLKHYTKDQISKMDDSLSYPNVYRFLQFDSDDIHALKHQFAKLLSKSSPEESAEYYKKYNDFFIELSKTSTPEVRNFVNSLVSQIIPEEHKPNFTGLSTEHSFMGPALHFSAMPLHKPADCKVLDVSAGTCPTIILQPNDQENMRVKVVMLSKEQNVKSAQLKLITEEAEILRRAGQLSGEAIISDNEVRITIKTIDGMPLDGTPKYRGAFAISKLNADDMETFIRASYAKLYELHNQGIYHGDIKGNNILVQKNQDGSLTVEYVDFSKSSIFDAIHNPMDSGIKGKKLFQLAWNKVYNRGERDESHTKDFDDLYRMLRGLCYGNDYERLSKLLDEIHKESLSKPIQPPPIGTVELKRG